MSYESDGIALDEFMGELTPREKDVAALVAQALSNEQIANRLSLSRGTVANHVAHILAKTGVTSRVQVAVVLARATNTRSTNDVLGLLTRLQGLGPMTLRAALQHATDVLASFFAADISAAFLYDPAAERLVAVATSDTRLGQRQHELGLDLLPLSHGGRVAWVFEAGRPCCDGHVEDDAFELIGVRRDLGVRSSLAVPFGVSPHCRGVLVVMSVAPEHFGDADVQLLQFVAYWVELVVQQHAAASNGHAPGR